MRIGGTKPIPVDVRIIAATNRDLWERIKRGKFRQDLYYRLNVINITIPPLRERRDDILPLALAFVEKYNRKFNRRKVLTMELGKVLRSLDWPGNIRELENLMENIVVLVQDDRLQPRHLPSRYRQSSTPGSGVLVSGILPLKEAIAQTEEQLLRNARDRYSTTREIAAVLGINQSTVSRKLSALAEKDGR